MDENEKKTHVEGQIEELVWAFLLDDDGNPVVTLAEYLSMCLRAFDKSIKLVVS